MEAFMILFSYKSRYTSKSGTSKDKDYSSNLQVKLGWQPDEREKQEQRAERRSGTVIREKREEREERELGLQREEKDREERRTENKQKGKRGNLALYKKKGKGLVQEERGATGSKTT
jgi:hypothetical protein